MDRSFDLVAVPFFSFASGTSVSMVFACIALHGSGSERYATFSRVADAFGVGFEDEEESDFFLALSEPESLPESEEQPATVRIIGTAAQARTRVRREADRCMVPSVVEALLGGALRARDASNGSSTRRPPAVRAVTRDPYAPRGGPGQSLKRSTRACAN